MAGSFAQIVIDGGISQLRCPITGIPLLEEHEGFDADAHHSPYLRFFVDWTDEAWFVDPADLPAGHTAYQRSVVDLLTNEDAFDSRQERIDECVAALPESALILEILDPPTGSFPGETCYVCFDLGTPASKESVQLHLAEYDAD